MAALCFRQQTAGGGGPGGLCVAGERVGAPHSGDCGRTGKRRPGEVPRRQETGGAERVSPRESTDLQWSDSRGRDHLKGSNLSEQDKIYAWGNPGS